MSINHQFIQFEDKVVKRYIKTTPSIVTGYRLDPYRPENRIDWLLQSPESSFAFITSTDGRVHIERKTPIVYQDEVLEIYSDQELKIFLRVNQRNIESGILVEYTQESPGMDLTNVLSDEEVNNIAATKQLLSLNKKLQSLTSVYTLERIKTSAEELDRPVSVVKSIQERINELSRGSTG